MVLQEQLGKFLINVEHFWEWLENTGVPFAQT
jgi:hypothetical protein